MRVPIIVPIEILKPYVIGKVFEYFSGFEKAPEAEGIHSYVSRTLEFVVPYLNGKEVLDARASDYQCQIAQSAYFDFKQMFDNSFNRNIENVKNMIASKQGALGK